MSDATLWIFGYGSLVWRPAFSHRRSRPAFVDGFARRFWQGSTDHRGLPGRPGRVATLLPDTHQSVVREPDFVPERCWGTAYEVPRHDPEGVLEALDHRERGGYTRLEVELTVVETDPGAGGIAAATRSARRVEGLVYIATPDNENYLGPAPLASIARQVAESVGPSGANPEYVFELARGLRRMGASDRHVFAVAEAVAAQLAGRGAGGGAGTPSRRGGARE